MAVLEHAHWETITDEMRRILHFIGQQPFADRFYLAGGTALDWGQVILVPMMSQREHAEERDSAPTRILVASALPGLPHNQEPPPRRGDPVLAETARVNAINRKSRIGGALSPWLVALALSKPSVSPHDTSARWFVILTKGLLRLTCQEDVSTIHAI